MLDAYRARGADPPFGDPSRFHGAGMEGFFWRLTDAAAGRVVVVLAAISRDAGGAPWGLVALAAHPGGLVRSLTTAQAWGDPAGPGLRLGEVLSADDAGLRADLGPGARVEAAFERHVRWPGGAWGAMGAAQAIPGLSQYWHPHLLGAAVRGGAQIGAATWDLARARAYAEKNWGAGGLPDTWWWGQAHGFAREDVSVAFAGGPARAGRLHATGTALVVAAGDEVLRLVRPPAPLAVTVDERGWRLRGRTLRHSVEIEAHARGEPHLLPVPVPLERRALQATSPQHLAGTLRVAVRRRGRPVLDETSALAGLERGHGA
jgi:Tocopherol cyclase